MGATKGAVPARARVCVRGGAACCGAEKESNQGMAQTQRLGVVVPLFSVPNASDVYLRRRDEAYKGGVDGVDVVFGRHTVSV